MTKFCAACIGMLMSSTVWADLDSIFTECNIAGLEQINSQKPDGDYAFGWPLGDLASHVFTSRVGNKGRGNGGEAYDLHFWGALGGVFGADCTSTTDEDTGGTLYSGDPTNPTVTPGSMFAPELDPGRGR